MKGFESGHEKSPNRFYLAIIFSNSALGLGGSGATAGRRYMSGPVMVWGWFDFKYSTAAG